MRQQDMYHAYDYRQNASTDVALYFTPHDLYHGKATTETPAYFMAKTTVINQCVNLLPSDSSF